jgi:starch synthase
VFDERHGHGFLAAVDRALRFFHEKRRLAALRKRVMALDLSWDASAKEYVKYYKEILKG